MWLLDHTLPHSIFRELSALGVACETAAHAGVDRLTNGALTQAAVDRGFTAIITRDKDFPLDAKKASERNPGLAVVVLLYDQSPPATLRTRFRAAWDKHGRIPTPSGVSTWPPAPF